MGQKADHNIEIIKPTINFTTNVYERSEKEANIDITFHCSFFSTVLNKTIIKYKGLLSFDFITEDQDKDHLDLKDLYEEGYNERFYR